MRRKSGLCGLCAFACDRNREVLNLRLRVQNEHPHLTVIATSVTIAASGFLHGLWLRTEQASIVSGEGGSSMDQSSIERRKRRGTLALAALAGLALLLAWSASGGAPDPMALAQEGATRTSTPMPPFTSPRGTPTFTMTPPPRPTPQPLR
jgi:hypothetical protein